MTGAARAAFRRNPGLARLLAAQVPADVADWLAFVAIGAQLAFTWQAGPGVFAWLAVAMGLPYLTVGLFAGALVDRWPLRPSLVLSNLGRAACYALLPLATGPSSLLALVALGATADSFFSPAKQAALQALVAEPDRMRANGLSLAINQGSKVLAPAAGGALLAVTSSDSVFLSTAAISAAAALLLTTLSLPPRDKQEGELPHLLEDIKEGLALLRRAPVLRGALLLMAGGFVAMFLYDTLIAPLIRDFGYDERTLGLCVGAAGGGGLLGALLMSAVGERAKPFPMIAFACAGGALLSASLGLPELMAFTPPALVIAAIFAGLGITGSAAVVPVRTVIQSETTDRTIARVSALSEAANMAALLTAPFLGAALAAQLGTGAAFIAGGAMFAVLSGMALVVGRGTGRRLDSVSPGEHVARTE